MKHNAFFTCPPSRRPTMLASNIRKFPGITGSRGGLKTCFVAFFNSKVLRKKDKSLAASVETFIQNMDKKCLKYFSIIKTFFEVLLTLIQN